MVGALIGGSVGAAIGAAIWGGIGNATGYEIGWIAWGVGVLVGLGVHIGGAKKLDEGAALLAAVLAMVGVGAGKYAGLYASVSRTVGDAARSITDENVVSYLADEVVASREATGQAVQWPAGVDPDEAWVETDYPADVWAEASANWNALDEDGRNGWRAFARSPVDPVSVTNQLYTSTISPFDLLWLALAVGSAYKIGSGGGAPE